MPVHDRFHTRNRDETTDDSIAERAYYDRLDELAAEAAEQDVAWMPGNCSVCNRLIKPSYDMCLRCVHGMAR